MALMTGDHGYLGHVFGVTPAAEGTDGETRRGLRDTRAACPQHEPGPDTLIREKDGQPADLFAFEDYPILAVCAGCRAVLRAGSFLRPFEQVRSAAPAAEPAR